MKFAQIIEDQGSTTTPVGAITTVEDKMVTVVCRRVEGIWEALYALVPVEPRGQLRRVALPHCFQLDAEARGMLESVWQSEHKE